MKIYQTSQLNLDEKKALQVLWNTEYPKRLAFESLEKVESYVEGLSQAVHFLLINKGTILGWAARFRRENESWFAIILSKNAQGKGIGTKLLNRLKENENSIYGWVIDGKEEKKEDGSYYRSPLEFYFKNDFERIEGERLELPTLSAVKIVWRAK